MQNQSETTPNVLATDLDGTLIPLDGDQANRDDLLRLKTSFANDNVSLVFVTGRHLASVESAIKEFQLPNPDWIICDVGATICKRTNAGWQPLDAYVETLRKILGHDSLKTYHSHFARFDFLKLQEPQKQGDFKMSFYSAAENIKNSKHLLEQELAKIGLNGSVIASVDPFNGDGLLDVLPNGVSKAFALKWWCDHSNRDANQIIFSGDSGNDYAAMVAGFKTIVVANATPELRNSVVEAHRAQGWERRLHLANGSATSGVLAGCQRFGLFDKLLPAVDS